MYSDCDLILPVTVPNEVLWAVSSMCLRSARASTDANIIVMLNNSPDKKLADDIREQCSLLDIKLVEMDAPFSLSVAFNQGAALGHAKYIAYGQCDTLFFDGWLDRLVELWEEHPEYYVVWPFTFSTLRYGQSYRQSYRLERRIVADGFPQGALSILRRADNYQWDERFTFWEMDADFSLHMQRNNLKGGLCLWSRVDHIAQTVGNNIDRNKHFGVADMGEANSQASRRLQEKWGLK
jgi:hypothetical protein